MCAFSDSCSSDKVTSVRQHNYYQDQLTSGLFLTPNCAEFYSFIWEHLGAEFAIAVVSNVPVAVGMSLCASRPLEVDPEAIVQTASNSIYQVIE